MQPALTTSQSGLPPLLHRHLHGPPHGRGLLPPRLLHWHRVPDARHLHDLGGHPVLAALPRPRGVHGRGQRVPLLPGHGNRVDVLPRPAQPRHRHDGVRLRHGRARLPRHGPPAAAHRRLRLDHPRHRVRAAGRAGRGELRPAHEGPAEEVGRPGGVGCVQGAGVYLLRGGELYCEFSVLVSWTIRKVSRLPRAFTDALANTERSPSWASTLPSTTWPPSRATSSACRTRTPSTSSSS